MDLITYLLLFSTKRCFLLMYVFIFKYCKKYEKEKYFSSSPTSFGLFLLYL